MNNLVSKQAYTVEEFQATKLERIETVKSGVGVFEKGQVFAMDFTTGKMVKYVKSASDGTEIIVSVALTGGDATSTDLPTRMMKLGAVELGLLKGVGVVTNRTGISVTTTLLTGVGSLTEAVHTYQLQGLDKSGYTALGTASSKTTATSNLSVQLEYTKPADVNAIRVWRTIDGGSTYKYLDLTSAQIDAGTFNDDGTLTWTSGTLLETTDFEGIQTMERSGIFVVDSIEGFNYNY